eukprot:gene20946-27798_t
MKALEQSMLKDSFTAGGDALRSASQISGGSKGGGKGAGGGKPKDDRMALIRQQENIAACQNKDNKALVSQVEANLSAAKRELASAKSEQKRMAGAVSGKESQSKFWSKF